MARLHNIPPFTGTREGICIYFMRGRFFVRTASSLTGDRVKKDPAFSETRKNSGLMGRASKIGSQVYNRIPGKRKEHNQYRMLPGKALKMLRQGIAENEITRLLAEWYI